MNSDSSNSELMKVVERAVRPVRATRQRKLRMRQELLAHVSAIYEEERSRLGDDDAAFEEACRRFGDPGELSQELDRSVGFWGRWNWREERIVDGFDRWNGYRPDRPPAWHWGRAALTAVASGALVAVLVYLLSLLIPDRHMTWDQAKRLLPVLFYFVAMTFVLYGTSVTMVSDFYDAEPPRWGRAVLRSVGCVVAMTLIFYAMYWAIPVDAALPLNQLPIVVGVNAMIPIGLILAIWAAENQARPYREWDRLRLDE
jgi:hypothetical protein